MTLPVSVAVATYNGERFIREQLASILDQDHLPVEIVVSDDGSTDATLEIVRSIAARRPSVPIRILESSGRRGGVTANFERAVTATTTTLVALADQDDVWHPNRLAAAVAAFAADESLLLVHSDARLVDDLGKDLDLTLLASLRASREDKSAINDGRGFLVLIRRNLVTGATVVFRRSLLETALPFATEWLHDEWLAIIASATGNVRLIDECLVDYRQHSANEIGASNPSLRHRIGRMLAPRGSRYVDLDARAAVLLERLELLGAKQEWLEIARDKAAFEAGRANYPRARLARLGPVIRQLRKYPELSSQGSLDIVRDLSQPA